MNSAKADSYRYQWPLRTPVVAIDIGTSRSAMSITFIGIEATSQEIILPDGCGISQFGQFKVQTCLLLKIQPKPEDDSSLDVVIDDPKKVDVQSFGDQAEIEYVHMDDIERDSFVLCKWYKMELFNSTAPDPILLQDASGPKVHLSVAITKTLEVFAETAVQHLRRTVQATLQHSDIVWVLTVPAIWSDRSKYMMRNCAFKAGLTRTIDDERLILCLEPEGVCFAALQQSSEVGGSAVVEDDFLDVSEELSREEKGSGADFSRMLSRRGNKFIILDAGGGTIDVTSYEITNIHPFQVKQLAAPTGGPYGSTQVDIKFEELIREVIGEDSWAVLCQRRDVRLELLTAWEKIKINLKDSATSRPQQLQLSTLQSEILTPQGLQLKQLIEQYRIRKCNPGKSNGKPGSDDDLAVADVAALPEAKGETRMLLPSALLASFFSPSIGLILDCLQTYMRSTRAAEASHLIVSGGYSSCPFLWNALRAHLLPDKYSSGSPSLLAPASAGCPGVTEDEAKSWCLKAIYMVSKPDTAIVRGAAIYGTAHKDKVTHRVSKYTYGQRLMRRFIPSHAEHQRRQDTVETDERGLAYLPYFDVHVQAGDEIPTGFLSQRHTSVPFSSTQSVCHTDVLSTDRKVVQFPDEKGVSTIAKFSFPVDLSVPFSDRSFETEFEFGGTEIVCRVYKHGTSDLVGSCTAQYH